MTTEEKKIMEMYKKEIILLVESCSDMEYLVAVYTFASTYTDKSK